MLKILTACVCFDALMTHLVCCVSAEEERRVRANDREYNEKFQYAVREFAVFYCTYSKYLYS